MEFRVLGPLEIWDNGQPLALGGTKQRLLLAILLLRANEVVSRAALIDEIWGASPPASAAHSVDAYVSRLRKVLHGRNGQEGMLVARPPGYMLTVGREQLDLQRFERLLEEGRRALAQGQAGQAAEELRAALALWAGPPLADLDFAPGVQSEAARLEELRMAAIEARIEADLALGRAAEVVPELESLVAKNPVRELLSSQLMLALYQSGRQAEALAVYQAARTQLSELGLEPSPALRQRERAILHQETSLELPSPSPTSPISALGNRSPPASQAVSGEHRPKPTRRWWSSLWPRRTLPRAAALGATAAAAAVAFVCWALFGRSEAPSARPPHGNGLAVVSARSAKLLAWVPLSTAPSELVRGFDSLWATQVEAGSVVRVDPGVGAVRDTIRVGGGPTGIAVSAHDVWVANTLEGTLLRVDPRSDTVTQTIAIGSAPSGVVSAAGSVWVTSHGNGTVSRVDPATGRVTKVLPTGRGASALAAAGGTIWVCNEEAGTVSRIDARTSLVTDVIKVGDAPSKIAVTSGGVWVLDRLDSTLSRIDPERGRVAAAFAVKGATSGLAAGGGSLWLLNEHAGSLASFDARQGLLARRAAVGDVPQAVSSAGDELWIAVQAGGASHRGGTLRVTDQAPNQESLDPAFPGASNSLLAMTNDGLVTLNHVAGAEGTELVPDLAIGLPAPANSGRSYTFRLRPGIHYSTGATVRANDVRHSFERLFEELSGGTSLFGSIVGARACMKHPASCDLSAGIVTDERTAAVTFRLTRPDPDFLYKLTLPQAYVLPGSTPARKPRSPLPATGPYRITSFRPGRSIRLERNPHFREWARAAQPDGYPDQIVYRLGRSASQGARSIALGQTDFMPSLGPLRAREMRLLRLHHHSQMRSHTVLLTGFLFLNVRVPPFDDLRVRRALNFALDRGRLVAAIGGRTAARPTCQILPPQMPGYRPFCPYTRNPRRDGRWRGTDLRRARRLVAASRTRGMRVTVWDTRSPPMALAEGRLTVAALRSLGYKASLRFVPVDRFYAYTNDARNRAQIIDGGWSADYPTATSFFGKLTCAQVAPPGHLSADPGQFCDPAVDMQIARATALQASDSWAASRAWARLDRELVSRAIWLPTFTLVATDLVSPRVGNYQYHAAWATLVDQLWVR